MTQDIRTIKPVTGRRVRWPATGKLLADEGEPVLWGSYWERMRQAGDVVIVPDETSAPAKPQSAKEVS